MSQVNTRRAFVVVCFLGGLLWFLQVSFTGHIKLLVRRFDMDTDPIPYTEAHPVWNCSKPPAPNTVEDILCMEPKKFLKNYKNPCWMETVDVLNATGYKLSKKQVLKCLPYFYIFGVCKTGTTDLFFRLTQHPQIVDNFGALKKETWFWSWRRFGLMSHNRKMNFSNFVNVFRANVIGRTKVRIEDGREYSDYITGHGDPMDFWDHRFWRQIPQNDPNADQPRVLTPHLVRHVQPNIKLIVMLREPAERLYSHYYHGGYGKSPEDFHEDVVDALKIMEACVALYSFRTCLYGKNISKMMNVPLTASLYYIHIKEWLDVFPKEQLLILRNEDYANNTKETLLKVSRYLDVGDISSYNLDHIVNTPHKYETRKKKSQGSMKNETLELLIDFFTEPNRKLAKLLNDTRFLWKDYKRRYTTKSKLPGNDSNQLIQQARERALSSANIQSRFRNMPQNQIRDRIQQEKIKRWHDLKRNQTMRMRNKQKEAESARVKAEQERLQKWKLAGMSAFIEQKKRIKELLEQKREEIAMLQRLDAGKINFGSKLGYQISNNFHGYFEGDDDASASDIKQNFESYDSLSTEENMSVPRNATNQIVDHPSKDRVSSNDSLRLKHQVLDEDRKNYSQLILANAGNNATLFISSSLNEMLDSLKKDVVNLKEQLKSHDKAQNVVEKHTKKVRKKRKKSSIFTNKKLHHP